MLARHESEDEFVLFLVRPTDERFISDFGKHWLRIPLYQAEHSLEQVAEPSFSFKERILALVRAQVRKRPTLLGIWGRMRHKVIPRRARDPDKIRRRVAFTRWFRHIGIDWILYTGPDALSFEAGIPYVMPVHDLQHRLQPEFPEVSANGEWESREYLFRNAIRHATLILADSEVGKEDILRFYGPYGASPDRIKVLPLLPSNYLSVDVPKRSRLRVRQAYHLPERYLFYPAQFWPHKNHARIIEALGLLKRKYKIEIHVVFCGVHSGEIRERTFRETMVLARRLGVSDRVHYLGRVPNEVMSGLYAEALALVMPTFFGPTNIPPLEAWAFGCPVLCSDIRGIREQIGDAGLLVPPRSTEAIAEGIYRLWTDKNLRDQLAARGHRRLAKYTPEDFRRLLGDIIRDANELVRGGRDP